MVSSDRHNAVYLKVTIDSYKLQVSRKTKQKFQIFCGDSVLKFEKNPGIKMQVKEKVSHLIIFLQFDFLLMNEGQ